MSTSLHPSSSPFTLISKDTNASIQDPRQFVPPTGQAWTSHRQLKSAHKNTIRPDDKDPRIHTIFSKPQVAIGQRAFLLQTAQGNILWDCIALLDQGTIDFINGKGGLKAIVISHPHYYTTHMQWGETFNCPVYIAAEDQGWTSREDGKGVRKLIGEKYFEIVEGLTVIKTGGHFPGSLVVHWEGGLFIADTVVTQPVSLVLTCLVRLALLLLRLLLF